MPNAQDQWVLTLGAGDNVNTNDGIVMRILYPWGCSDGDVQQCCRVCSGLSEVCLPCRSERNLV